MTEPAQPCPEGGRHEPMSDPDGKSSCRWCKTPTPSPSVTVDRNITTPENPPDPQHNWSYNSGAVSAPMAEPDAGKSEPTASVLTVPVTSYPSSPESQGA